MKNTTGRAILMQGDWTPGRIFNALSVDLKALKENPNDSKYSDSIDLVLNALLFEVNRSIIEQDKITIAAHKHIIGQLFCLYPELPRLADLPPITRTAAQLETTLASLLSVASRAATIPPIKG